MGTPILNHAELARHNFQLFKTPYPMRQGIRLFVAFAIAIYVVSITQVSAFDDAEFFPIESLTFRQFVHRHPGLAQTKVRRIEFDRSCGTNLTVRAQRICLLGCPPSVSPRRVIGKRALSKYFIINY
jgi:hypothetical protein